MASRRGHADPGLRDIAEVTLMTWGDLLRTVPPLTATVTATSATVDRHLHTPTTVYLGTGVANRAVVSLKSGRSAVRPRPCPPPLNSQKTRAHRARGLFDDNGRAHVSAARCVIRPAWTAGLLEFSFHGLSSQGLHAYAGSPETWPGVDLLGRPRAGAASARDRLLPLAADRVLSRLGGRAPARSRIALRGKAIRYRAA